MIYLSIIISYLLGSVPFGYIITKFAKGVDIRKYGSGNIGATNVARVSGKWAGIVTLFLDILKGFIAVTVIPLLVVNTGNFDLIRIYCGVAVVLGHNWTVFLRFRGGKGVATSAGALIGLAPFVFLSSLCVWLVVFILSRYVSLASIIAAISLPLFLYLFGKSINLQVLGYIVAVVGIYRHKENIKRLLKDKENKLYLWTR